VQGSVTQVTRICQEPGAATATVTATIAVAPTPLYWRLKKVIAAVSGNQTLANDSGYPAVWASFPEWPSFIIRNRRLLSDLTTAGGVADRKRAKCVLDSNLQAKLIQINSYGL
jgi:hypothetical protein